MVLDLLCYYFVFLIYTDGYSNPNIYPSIYKAPRQNVTKTDIMLQKYYEIIIKSIDILTISAIIHTYSS